MRVAAIVSGIVLIGTTACTTLPDTPDFAELPSAIVVEAVSAADAADVRSFRVEEVEQNNCGGSAISSQLVERSRSVSHTAEFGEGVTVSAGGSVGFPGIGAAVEVGAEIAREHGVTYGEVESITRSLTVSAEPGTHMQHRIGHSEIWESGDIFVTAGEETQEHQYSLRKDFKLELVGSEDLGCPTPTPTPTPPPAGLTPTELTPTETPATLSEALEIPTAETATSSPSPSPAASPTSPTTLVVLSLTVEPSDAGRIDVTPPPNQDGGYRPGTNVLLTAVPNSGFEFTSWTGGARGSINPLSFNISSNISVTAVFSALPTPTPTQTPALTPTPTPTATPTPVFLSFTAQPSGGGTVDVVPPPNQDGGYRPGTNVLLTAVPNAGFEFTSWAGGASGSINPLSFNISSNISVTAVFSALPTPTSTPTPTPTPTPVPAPVFDPSPFQFEPVFGSSGDTVILFGSNFDGPNLRVTFGGTPATIVSFNATQIVVVVPSGITGSGKITVTVDEDLSAISDDLFTIL